MTYKIMTESMQGTIKVENKDIIYNDKTYHGAKFTVTLPFEIQDDQEVENV
jgi:signal transduction histidine kinase